MNLFGSDLASVGYGLMSAASWGSGDFSGGYSTRRTPVLTVLIFSQITGLVALILFALAFGEPAPSRHDLLIGAAAGIVGDIGLAALYRAMAIGKMSIAAPLSAVLQGLLPVIFGIVTQGLPGGLTIFGFGLALVGVWLISQPGSGHISSDGLGLAVLAGMGFGGFLTLVALLSDEALFWSLAVSRMTSITVMLILAVSMRRLAAPTGKYIPLIMFCGVMDVGGNVFFALAEEAGRVDVASVLSSLYPATTVVLALVILKERLTRWQGVGVLCAMTAIGLIATG